MNTGVIVKLKSGGPTMTVVEADAEKNVMCTWFDVNGIVHNGTFKLPTLQREQASAGEKPTRKAA